MKAAPAQKRVLIAEDDEPIRSALAELFTDEGYQVSTAANGQEALDILRASTLLPNVILLDLMMPIKDGVAFRAEQELDPRLAKIPVVLMSADEELEIKKIKVGLRHHIRKPLDVESVLMMVKLLTA